MWMAFFFAIMFSLTAAFTISSAVGINPSTGCVYPIQNGMESSHANGDVAKTGLTLSAGGVSLVAVVVYGGGIPRLTVQDSLLDSYTNTSYIKQAAGTYFYLFVSSATNGGTAIVYVNVSSTQEVDAGFAQYATGIVVSSGFASGTPSTNTATINTAVACSQLAAFGWAWGGYTGGNAYHPVGYVAVGSGNGGGGGYDNIGVWNATTVSGGTVSVAVQDTYAPQDAAILTSIGPPPPPTVATAPSGLVVTNVTDTTVDLSWVNPSGESLTDSLVNQSLGSGCTSPTPIDLGSVQTTYHASGLASSTLFSFEVSVSNSTGFGPASACISVSTLAPPPPPPPPSPASLLSNSIFDIIIGALATVVAFFIWVGLSGRMRYRYKRG
jgi:hypothetical protein